MGKISIVINTKNEEKNLPGVLPHIPAWVDEVVLVDGHSTDRTVDVAGRLRPDLRPIEMCGGLVQSSVAGYAPGLIVLNAKAPFASVTNNV